MLGVYAYICKETNDFIYIGKDKHIELRERDRSHHRTDRKDESPINKWLYENTGKYTYVVLVRDILSENVLSVVESSLIKYYNPLMNVQHNRGG